MTSLIAIDYACYNSIALSKIERGNSHDIANVKLVQQKIITLDELDVAYQEVLAQLGQGRYPKLTPQRFSERYLDTRRYTQTVVSQGILLQSPPLTP